MKHRIKSWLVCIFSMFFLYINTGIIFNIHTCNSKLQSFISFISLSCESSCCNDVACDVDDSCCENAQFFSKFNYQSTVKYSDDVIKLVEKVFSTHSNNSKEFSELILIVKNCFPNFKNKFIYLQPDIHKLQVMLC